MAKINDDLGVARELAAIRAHRDLAQQIGILFIQEKNSMNTEKGIERASLRGSVIKSVSVENEYLFILTCLDPAKISEFETKYRQVLRREAKRELEELDKAMEKLRE